MVVLRKAGAADHGEMRWAGGKGVFPVFSLSFFSLMNDPGALAHPSWASGSLLVFPLLLTRASSLAWSLLLGRAVGGTHSQEVV